MTDTFSRAAKASRSGWLCLATAALLCWSGLCGQTAWAAGQSELSDEPIPLLDVDNLPQRTPPIIEIGPSFLGTGNIPRGIELPTGAVWTPSLWVFGDFQTAFNYTDRGDGVEETADWANQLDVFFNLQLSGTERILLGLSPLHDDDQGQWSGYAFEPDDREGFINGTNSDIETFFFEGEFGEIFPDLDPEDKGFFDFGFSVGRQQIFFQEGMMFNDIIDAVGITRDTIILPGISSVDTRLTGIFGWNEINRDDNDEVDDDIYVIGLFSETDFAFTTTNLDIAYVVADEVDGGDGLFVGTSATQRIDLFGITFNTSFRGNASFAIEDENEAVSTGGLLFAEISTTPVATDDVLYGNFYAGIDNYSSAARNNLAGGPLGRVGLLFAAEVPGNYPPPLSNRADEVVGGVIGYQWIIEPYRTQAVFELGGTKGTDEDIDDAVALGARLQHAIGNRYIIRLDGYGRWHEEEDFGYGMRTEFLTRF